MLSRAALKCNPPEQWNAALQSNQKRNTPEYSQNVTAQSIPLEYSPTLRYLNALEYAPTLLFIYALEYSPTLRYLYALEHSPT